MPRPIVWAAGILVTYAVSSVMTGERLASRFGGSDARLNAVQPSDRTPVVTLSADLAGHYVLHPSLDGRRIRMLVDTGASVVALTYEDARAAGIEVRAGQFTRRMSTANGLVDAAPVRVGEVRIGDIVVRGVDAVVLPQGRLGTSLLGMSFLTRLRGFEIAAGRLTLKG